ncbi:three-Cys-motif partner protein TcmP [Proteiniclasticum sp. QWL-01]|uniref:three-Cys-motif partner protein TcmP n=1 Tax=Proteiniclasticum sp. QWL-01 TaxID=3036945 RepID=UPI00240F7D58|nr:three-Cys-motif partner protein TcmP [Proteiniclasticum sp. QWL-01]WFF71821.1 three-Cys-motif partner protein TcmP [Proteiniclasticum sp. QWL-01]
MNNEFFQEQREQSIIKARIVSKYFSTWASIILATQKRYPQHAQRMAYIDLFAGPGRYDDQSKSTPLLVLETILSNPDLTSRMVTLFNDKDAANIESLKTAIAQVPGIKKLKYAPSFYNEEVGDEIAKMFSSKSIVPTFFFVDPWGYKGLSLNLVSSIIKDWGCDCVFFFNYNRVNMGVNNDAIKQHMASLFGGERLDELRNQLLDTLTTDEREVIVVQELCDALRQNGSRFVLPFRFKNNNGARTSHHLIFLSKNFRGYEIMKEIMAKESSDTKDGVANFEYNPREMYYRQGTLFDLLSRPLDELQGMLIEQYAGRTIDFLELYEEHSVDRPYIKKNYKEVLRTMFDTGLISAVNPKTNNPPRKGSFSDEMRITFGGAV